MKVGMRTPNLKKRLKANTTAKAKRAMKSAINPLYGKKGMGLINDPKKAVYNKVYNKTTVSADKVVKATFKPKKRSKGAYKFFTVIGIIITVVSALIAVVDLAAIVPAILGVCLVAYGLKGGKNANS